jgi:hypothetical protein
VRIGQSKTGHRGTESNRNLRKADQETSSPYSEIQDVFSERGYYVPSLLAEPEGMLVINTVRILFHYLNARAIQRGAGMRAGQVPPLLWAVIGSVLITLVGSLAPPSSSAKPTPLRGAA